MPPNPKITIPTFDWQAKNKFVEWQDYRMKIDNIFSTSAYKDIAHGADRVALILNWMGLEALKKYNSWDQATKDSFKDDSEACTEAFYTKMASGWANSGNAHLCRIQFGNMQREKHQTGDDYMDSLRLKAATCNFKDPDDRIRDRFVGSINDDHMRNELLKEMTVKPDITLEDLLTITRRVEAITLGTAAMGSAAQFDSISRGKGRGRGGKSRGQRGGASSSSSTSGNQCDYCGRSHPPGKQNCRAYGKECRKCGRLNHFDAMCRQGQQGQRQHQQQQQNYGHQPQFHQFSQQNNQQRGSRGSRGGNRGHRGGFQRGRGQGFQQGFHQQRRVHDMDAYQQDDGFMDMWLNSDQQQQGHQQDNYDVYTVEATNSEVIDSASEHCDTDPEWMWMFDDALRELDEITDSAIKAIQAHRYRSSTSMMNIGQKKAVKEQDSSHDQQHQQKFDDNKSAKISQKAKGSKHLKPLKKDYSCDAIRQTLFCDILCESTTGTSISERFKIDSGSNANILPANSYRRIFPNVSDSQLAMSKSNTRLSAYNDSEISHLGECRLNLSWRGQRVQAKFFISTHDVPILSLETSMALGIISVHCDAVTSNTHPTPNPSKVGGKGCGNKVIIGDKDKSTSLGSQHNDGDKLGGKGSFAQNAPSQANTVQDKHRRYFVSGPGIDMEQDMKKSRAFKEMMFSRYNDVFTGQGQLKGKVKLELKEGATPYQAPVRRVAYSMVKPFNDEIDRLLKGDIIEELAADERSEWCNSYVLVRKQNGTVRLCLDPTKLNEHLMRPVYPTQKLDDILPKLHGATYFSIIDAKCGYWNLQLDEASSYLTTFSCMRGRFRFKRLPFGLSASGDLFQCKLDAIFNDIELETGIADDMVIFGYEEDGRDHDTAFEKVMQRARENGIKFNPDKCILRCTALPFFGQLNTRLGQKPDPEKVETIKEYPVPTTKEEIHSFVGFANYLAKFVPKCAEFLKPLRELTSAKNEFIWLQHHQECFQSIKDMVTNDCLLAYYSDKKRLFLEVDASKEGLGAVLLQTSKDDQNLKNAPDGIPEQAELRPIAYASKSLTKTERRYANNERELLAVLHGLEKFKHYTFGRQVEVITDHKSLTNIVQKDVNESPPRLQRLLLRCHEYNFTLTYRRGKNMFLSDALSRLRTHRHRADPPLETQKIEVHSAEVGASTSRVQQIGHETQNDPTLRDVYQYIKQGWPDTAETLPDDCKVFYHLRDELSILDNIIIRGSRIVIPEKLKNEVMSRLHGAHQNAEKMTALAKHSVYWPNMTKQCEMYVKKCIACEESKNTQRKEPLLPTDVPQMAWTLLGSDVYFIGRKTYLIFVDYYSKWPVIRELRDNSARSLVNTTQQIFGEYGLPKKIISDAGTNYTSREFQEFCVRNNIEHKTSSSYHHSANGQAERVIAVIKQIFKKCEKTGENPYIALLYLRVTPISRDLPSPARLMGRKLRTLLPEADFENIDDYLKERFRERQRIMKEQHDKHRGARSLPQRNIGDKVMVQAQHGGPWTQGQITGNRGSEHGNRSYEIDISQTGRKVVRNNQHIRHSLLERYPRLQHSFVSLSNGTWVEKIPPKVPQAHSQQQAAKISDKPSSSENVAKPETILRRSGRISKPVQRLGY